MNLSEIPIQEHNLVHNVTAYYYFKSVLSFVWYKKQVLKLMQVHPKERLRRAILTASWFNAINVEY